jgi:hypothetical protein
MGPTLIEEPASLHRIHFAQSLALPIVTYVVGYSVQDGLEYVFRYRDALGYGFAMQESGKVYSAIVECSLDRGYHKTKVAAQLLESPGLADPLDGAFDLSTYLHAPNIVADHIRLF